MSTRAQDLFDLRGRVVIVTGGGRGIGRVYATHLAAAGARVLVADLDGEAARGAEGEIRGEGGVALAEVVDISDPAATERMARAALGAWGQIDGLVNNASLMSSLPRRPWDQIPVAEWDRVMAVDLRGLFLCCRAVVPAMREAGRGRIVNISSTRVFEGTPNRLHYTTAKAGVIGFTRALARELGDFGIGVNVITPGLTRSDTQVASSAPGYLSGDYDEQRAFKRAQLPEDLVGAVLFLLSDASAFITGQVLNVDGGKTLH
jgi:3-oxoacyl-[acyl-carrier protein] reductase